MGDAALSADGLQGTPASPLASFFLPLPELIAASQPPFQLSWWPMDGEEAPNPNFSPKTNPGLELSSTHSPLALEWCLKQLALRLKSVAPYWMQNTREPFSLHQVS